MTTPKTNQTNEAPIDAAFKETALVAAEAQTVELLAPAMGADEAAAQFKKMVAFVSKVMIPGVDYGTIAGTRDDKPTLLKPGAEKLARYWGYEVDFVLVENEMHWSPSAPLFYFRYQARLSRAGLLVATSEGSANNLEKKYRWRWVREDEIEPGLDIIDLMKKTTAAEEYQFAIDKRETGGQWGKPESYWVAWDEAFQNKTALPIKKKTRSGEEKDAWRRESLLYRVPNPEPFDLINTLGKMAQKRALVAAVLIGCYASALFTQDLEDLGASGANNGATGHRTYNPPVDGGAEQVVVQGNNGEPTIAQSTEQNFWDVYFQIGNAFSPREKAVARAVGDAIIAECEGDFDAAILLLEEHDKSGELALLLMEKIDARDPASEQDGFLMTVNVHMYLQARPEIDVAALALATGRGVKRKPLRLSHVREYERRDELVPAPEATTEDEGASDAVQ